MPVDAVYLWLLTRVLFCCTRGLGCNAHPAFPAPSLFSRVVCFQHLGHVMPRERGLVSAVLLAADPSRRRATARLLDEVVAREARQFKPGDDIGERGCLKIESESRRVRCRPERFRASSHRFVRRQHVITGSVSVRSDSLRTKKALTDCDPVLQDFPCARRDMDDAGLVGKFAVEVGWARKSAPRLDAKKRRTAQL